MFEKVSQSPNFILSTNIAIYVHIFSDQFTHLSVQNMLLSKLTVLIHLKKCPTTLKFLSEARNIHQARSKQILVGQARKWVWFVVN